MTTRLWAENKEKDNKDRDVKKKVDKFPAVVGKWLVVSLEGGQLSSQSLSVKLEVWTTFSHQEIML